jgi:hypothetical protein
MAVSGRRKKRMQRAKAWVRANELDIRLHALKTLFALPKGKKGARK